MDKPKILIATAVRNTDGSFAIADDEVDILTAYRTLEYGELSGMNAYGKPVTYAETYAEGGTDVFFAKGNATTGCSQTGEYRTPRKNIIPPPISLDALTWSATDYQDVPIPENSVIYCDIPYKGTNRYAGKGADFDHDRFYEWALRQTQPIFISSYDMPKEDFKVIAEYSRTDTLSATNNSLRVTERIFIPRTQEYVKDNRKYKNENEQ